MFALIKRFIPHPLIRVYHYLLALAANFFYRYPSEKLIVIGVTGTSGKSTVVYLTTKLLESAGFKVGAASTIMFKVNKKEWLNDKKMTMLGRFGLQRLLRQMVRANCQYAVIETTSQGIEQFRHLGINYDIVVCTNLYSEHIEAHGGFENYKAAKLKLFKQLKQNRTKKIAGQKIIKTSIVNLDDQYVTDFLHQPADKKIGITLTAAGNADTDAEVIAVTDVTEQADGITFVITGQQFTVPLYGRHNVYNVAFASAIGVSQGLSLASLSTHTPQLTGVPGRLEFITEGQPFTVIVDYAFEPKAVVALYDVVKKINHQRIIHVLGSAGGGRDVARRPVLGELAGRGADIVIVTNEDPYDEDPMTIIQQVAEGARQTGKVSEKNLFTILDRRAAIVQAFKLARPHDVVLVTGKGSEQAMVVKHHKHITWDDRLVVKEELKSYIRK